MGTFSDETTPISGARLIYINYPASMVDYETVRPYADEYTYVMIQS